MIYYQIDLDLLQDKSCPIETLSRENACKLWNTVPGTLKVLTYMAAATRFFCHAYCYNLY